MKIWILTPPQDSTKEYENDRLPPPPPPFFFFFSPGGTRGGFARGGGGGGWGGRGPGPMGLLFGPTGPSNIKSIGLQEY